MNDDNKKMFNMNLDRLILAYLRDDLTPYSMLDECFTMTDEELISNIETGKFEKYAFMLPIMMMFSKQQVISSSWKRVCLELYCRALNQIGQEELESLTISIIKDEKEQLISKNIIH